MMMRKLIKTLFSLLAALPLVVEAADVNVLFSTELMDIPGKTSQLLRVEYAPGESSAEHRHNAHTLVYVLEGSVVMQVRGGEAQTLRAGDTFYENPEDIHSVSRNASETAPATLLVFFIKQSDAPATVPVNH